VSGGPTRPLFRPEAVEAHARGRGVDDEGLELKERRTTWAFRLLVLALVATIAAGFMVQVDETARGQATVAGRNAVINLPVAAGPRVRPGQPVTLNGVHGTIVDIRDPASNDSGVAVLPVLAYFPEGQLAEGEATVRLARRRLASLLLRRDRG
jgi:hypothetical protein